MPGRQSTALRPQLINALGCAALALGLRRAAARLMRFDGRYGQDAYAYAAQARALLESLRERRPPPRFFWPQGYPALAAAFIAATGAADAEQRASAYAGAASAAWACLLAHDTALALPDVSESQARRAGLTAGLTMACAALPLRAGLVTMADAAATHWATLACWAALRYARAPHIGWALLAGAALSLATQTRWLNATLALPLLLASLGRAKRRDVLAASALAALLLLPQAQITARNPGPLLQHDWLMRWAPRNALRRRVQNTDGHYAYRLPMALYYAQPLAHPAALTPLLAPCALYGALALAQRRARPELALLLGWILPQYGFLCGVPYQNFRYTQGYLPPLAALAAVGAARLPARAWRWLALLVSIAQLAWAARELRGLLRLDRPYRAVAAWTAALPPGTTLICFGVTDTVRHRLPTGHGLRVVELYYQSEASLRALLAEGGPCYLALDVQNALSQWRGYLPERLLLFLDEGWRLEEAAHFAPFTVFRVAER